MDWRQQFTNLSRGRGLMLAIGALLVATYSIFMVLKDAQTSNLYNHQSTSCCQFPAIYNFGDSNSDTGAVSAVFDPVLYPNGITYFQKPSARLSDGRLMIDFIAENLGLPYLSAYVDSIGTNFRHGANFAASGATIQPADALMLNKTFNPLTLDVQLSQFEQFKTRSFDIYLEADMASIVPHQPIYWQNQKSSVIKDRLPRPEDYAQALYTFDIGQNDLHAGVITMNEEQVKKYIPSIINVLSSVVEKLYQGGARSFWIHNTGPLGCLPYFIENYPLAPDNVDKIGCVKSYNEVAQEFNKQLKDEVSELRKRLQESLLVYVDIYSVKYSLISEATKHGFTDPLGKCVWKDGNVIKPCANPLQYINWDGIHYTEAANKWFANHLQDGSVSEPKIPLNEACWSYQVPIDNVSGN